MAKLTEKTVTIQERGWAGHYCLAHLCRFHRNTLLAYGDTRIVVSTVGNLMIRRGDTLEVEEIGLDRYYETAVFLAKYDGYYWDADVTRQIAIDGMKWQIGEMCDGVDNYANEIHEAAVCTVADRLRRGDRFGGQIEGN